MFCSTLSLCRIACRRSAGICLHFGITSFLIWFFCSGVSPFQIASRRCSSCLCAGGRFLYLLLFSRIRCFSCGVRSLNFLCACGGVYEDGGRLGLLFGLGLGRGTESGRFAPFPCGFPPPPFGRFPCCAGFAAFFGGWCCCFCCGLA